MLSFLGTLRRRHIRTDGRCVLCGVADETLLHALMDCNHAQVFWKAIRKHVSIKLPRLHPSTWAADLTDCTFSHLMRGLLWLVKQFCPWSRSVPATTHGPGNWGDGFHTWTPAKGRTYIVDIWTVLWFEFLMWSNPDLQYYQISFLLKLQILLPFYIPLVNHTERVDVSL